MTDEEVRALADEVLCDTLGPLGFEKAQVVSGLDHDGEPALFIAAIFKPGSGPIPGRAWIDALGALSDALLARGEGRFPYLFHHYPDDERSDDQSPAKQAAG